MSTSLPIAEWLAGHSGKQGVAGSIPGEGIHYHFEIFYNVNLFTSRTKHTNEIKHDIHLDPFLKRILNTQLNTQQNENTFSHCIM